MIADSILYGGIIIDTNAFDAKGNDFCGCFNAILPSFFATTPWSAMGKVTHWYFLTPP